MVGKSSIVVQEAEASGPGNRASQQTAVLLKLALSLALCSEKNEPTQTSVNVSLLLMAAGTGRLLGHLAKHLIFISSLFTSE